MHYTGWLFDQNAPDKRGQQFDSSRDRGEPLVFRLGTDRVIRGWVALAQLAYAATIVSFIGALHWGLAMRDATLDRAALWQALGWGVLRLPLHQKLDAEGFGRIETGSDHPEVLVGPDVLEWPVRSIQLEEDGRVIDLAHVGRIGVDFICRLELMHSTKQRR